MTIKQYEKSLTSPLKQATLIFLLKDKEILLAMKKRGFGVGKWNGTGGKVGENESIKKAAIREAQEEINVTPKGIKKVAIISFYFPHNNFGQQVHVFTAKKWDGVPTETEEMKPKWFKEEKIPYKKMWWDDEYWLPLVLKGKKVKGSFMFDENDKIADHYLKEAKNLR